MPYTMMLDAGHGGRDPGAVYQGRQEKDDNLALVLAIGEVLQENGVDVEYTRTTDIYQTPFEKAMLANNAGVDFFLSIHRNSFPTDNQVSGVESLVYNLSGLKYEMAQNINAQLETVGFVDLGVKARPNLVVLRRTQMPAVLTEVGFINSDVDNQLLDENFDAIVQAIARGVLDTLESAGLVAMTQENSETEVPENEAVLYHVQTGSFRNEKYADRLLKELQEQEYPAFIEEFGPYFRVRVGEFRTLDEAVKMERRLKMAGYQTVVVS